MAPETHPRFLSTCTRRQSSQPQGSSKKVLAHPVERGGGVRKVLNGLLTRELRQRQEQGVERHPLSLPSTLNQYAVSHQTAWAEEWGTTKQRFDYWEKKAIKADLINNYKSGNITLPTRTLEDGTVIKYAAILDDDGEERDDVVAG